MKRKCYGCGESFDTFEMNKHGSLSHWCRECEKKRRSEGYSKREDSKEDLHDKKQKAKTEEDCQGVHGQLGMVQNNKESSGGFK